MHVYRSRRPIGGTGSFVGFWIALAALFIVLARLLGGPLDWYECAVPALSAIPAALVAATLRCRRYRPWP